MEEVRDSILYVVERADHVWINPERLTHISKEIYANRPTIPTWDYTLHYFDATERTLYYLFVLDTINFCFWPKQGHKRWSIRVGGKELSGYYGLAAGLKGAFEKGYPLDDPTWLASLKIEDLEEILSGKGKLQLMEERVMALRELGTFFLDKWAGRPAKFVEACRASAVRLALWLASELPSFADFSYYKGRKILFYKRAQLLAADLYCAFRGKGWGRFLDMEELTAFADYKLPQVLRHMGILQYSPSLAKRIDSRELIPPGSPEEVEIRATTIWAVELLLEELGRLGLKMRAFELDWILWNLGQQDVFRKKPYHLTITRFY